jgi:hypothetical protein
MRCIQRSARLIYAAPAVVAGSSSKAQQAMWVRSVSGTLHHQRPLPTFARYFAPRPYYDQITVAKRFFPVLLIVPDALELRASQS